MDSTLTKNMSRLLTSALGDVWISTAAFLVITNPEFALLPDIIITQCQIGRVSGGRRDIQISCPALFIMAAAAVNQVSNSSLHSHLISSLRRSGVWGDGEWMTFTFFIIVWSSGSNPLKAVNDLLELRRHGLQDPSYEPYPSCDHIQSLVFTCTQGPGYSYPSINDIY